MLAFQLDSITEAHENLDFLSAIGDAIDYGVAPDLSDIHTLYIQDGIIERDTDVLVEYHDGDTHGYGIVISWHSDPFDLYGEDDSEDYAYIVSEDGKSSTYAHFANLNPICEVEKYDVMEGGAIVPPMQSTVTFSGQGSSSGQNSVRDLYQLPMLPSLPSKIGA